MRTFTDQMGRSIKIVDRPKRIISLVPSQTELLFDLGLNEEIIGITKFCIHPESFVNSKAKIGGTKAIDFEAIKALNPDLIIGNKEENEEGQIKELMKHYPVWMSDIENLDEAYDMIINIGELVGKLEKAIELKENIRRNFSDLKSRLDKTLNNRVGYFIWRKPYMSINQDTFIHSILSFCGFQNVFTDTSSRYPEILPEQIKIAAPDFIFLSSEPFPFKTKHIKEFQAISPLSKILLVDGEMFSWYGSRLALFPAYFQELLSQLK